MLNVNDFLDKRASFEYKFARRSNRTLAFGNSSNESYAGRFISVPIEKAW